MTPQRNPGTIIDAKDRLLIATGDNPLEILELQSAGTTKLPSFPELRPP